MKVIQECAQCGAEGHLLDTPDGYQCATCDARGQAQARQEASCTQCGLPEATESGVCVECETAPLSDAEFEILAAADAAIAQDLEDQWARDKVILEQVRQMVPVDVFKEIEEFLAQDDCSDYSIVEQPVGEAQDDGYILGDVYVDQTMNGGMAGDSYAGTICLPLGCGKYLKYDYTC
ncbi:hypothetical protein [Pseudomonas sp. EMN2]|uniref:hypothetical protein n=1 Tax=Pseudomonas sp. EMN2 TaxID=2615212 RepID=UPI00129BD40D|nr:hypothetical protein [Pseudomonas sp. EMN2]